MEEEQQNLGNLVDCFPVRSLGVKRVLWVIIGIVLIIISLAFGIIRLVDTWKAIEIHGRAILLNRIPLPLLMFGVVLPIGLGTVLFAKHHWNDSIKIYELGMVKHTGNHSQSWLWWQTDRIDNRVVYIKFAGNAVGVRVTITLDDQKQNHFTLKNHYDRMDELTQQIRQHVLPVLYSKAHHQLQRGETIRFHEHLKVNRNSIQIKDYSYPWQELSSPSINNGVITISDTSSLQKVFRSNINQLENLDLLIHLFENPPTQAN